MNIEKIMTKEEWINELKRGEVGKHSGNSSLQYCWIDDKVCFWSYRKQKWIMSGGQGTRNTFWISDEPLDKNKRYKANTAKARTYSQEYIDNIIENM